MPGLDGFGLLEKIRGSHLPHIRTTGHHHHHANDTDATMSVQPRQVLQISSASHSTLSTCWPGPSHMRMPTTRNRT